MENNSQPISSTTPLSTPPTQSIMPQKSSKTTIILLIILVIIIIAGGVVFYLTNQPSYSTIYDQKNNASVIPTNNILQPSVIIPTVTPTIDEELQNLDIPLDTDADFQNIDADLQQL